MMIRSRMSSPKGLRSLELNGWNVALSSLAFSTYCESAVFIHGLVSFGRRAVDIHHNSNMTTHLVH